MNGFDLDMSSSFKYDIKMYCSTFNVTLNVIEDWLIENIGAEYNTWIWAFVASNSDCDFKVSFKKEKDAMLFALKWL
jgi:hypothetical protein